MIGIDYLQKLGTHRKFDSREKEIAHISGRLKELAKSLNIPVVVLAQLNRSAEGREDRRPRLSDLRESGAIEQDADVVMLLYREEQYDPETERRGIVEVDIAKNRTGPTGMVELAFIKEYTRFENLSSQPPGSSGGY